MDEGEATWAGGKVQVQETGWAAEMELRLHCQWTEGTYSVGRSEWAADLRMHTGLRKRRSSEVLR